MVRNSTWSASPVPTTQPSRVLGVGRTVAVEDISRTSARDGPREKLSHVVSEESRDRTISPDRVSRDHDAVLTKPPGRGRIATPGGWGSISSRSVRRQCSHRGRELRATVRPRRGVASAGIACSWRPPGRSSRLRMARIRQRRGSVDSLRSWPRHRDHSPSVRWDIIRLTWAMCDCSPGTGRIGSAPPVAAPSARGMGCTR